MIAIANYDGSVTIDTTLNTNGLAKGISNIKSQFGTLASSVKKLGVAIGLAFGVQQIVQFGKEASSAAMELESAMMGLRSILEGQGRSFAAAQKFIEEYTQDGLIPATNAVTAYKNLASRGYDDSQIRQVMVALKDASAFGRQANYSMGEAVQSATEGLKNENSILVDNAGVTKNVAKMWEEYAESIGTTANNLTQQQKIQAEVTGILAESKYQVGDAAIVANTLSGQLQQLSFNFNNLKVAVGNIINPILQSFLPAVNAAITALTKLANAVATVMSLIFGKVSTSGSEAADTMDGVAGGYGSAADAAEDYGDAATAAGNAAKKSLASFDELNKLQGESTSGGGSASAAGIGGTASAGNISAEADVEDTISPKIQAVADKIKELIEPLRNIDLTPAAEAFERLKQAIEPITQKLFEGLEWAWYNILVPLAAWTIEDALPAFLDLVSAGLGLLNTAIEGLQPLGQWLWDEFLVPLAEWTGGVIIDSLNGLADALTKISDWIDEHQEGINNFVILVGSIAGALGAVSVIARIASAIKDISLLANGAQIAMSPLLGTIMSWIAEIGMVFSNVGTWISGLATTISTVLTAIAGALGISVGWLVAIVAAVAAAVAAIIIYWDEIKVFFTETIPQIWEKFKTWLSGILSQAASFFSDCWEKIKEFFSPAIEWFGELWSSVSQTFEDIFYNIGVIVSGCWEIIKAAWGVAADWFDQNIIQPVADFFSSLWASISTWAIDAWQNICAVFSIVAGWINQNVVQPVSGFFRSLWDDISSWAVGVWENVCSVFGNVVSFFRGILNGVISALNSALSWIFGGINEILGSLKGISVLGISPFSGLRTISVPQIPYLAQGAVIPPNAPFMAVLGDQRSGNNIEAPESLIRKIVREESGSGDNSKLEELLETLISVVEGIEVGDEVIGKAAARYNRKTSRAWGT